MGHRRAHVHPEIQERAREEEQRLLRQEAQGTWKAIQDYRPQRGALGPDEVFAALWQRRVQTLLDEPGRDRAFAARPVAGCTHDDLCVVCGGQKVEVPDVDEEAVQDAIEQDANVRYWEDPACTRSIPSPALKRF